MPMMVPSSTIPADYLLHGAFFLTALAFLVRDVLWLRLLAILANVLLITAGLRAGMGMLSPTQYWYILLIAINTVHAGVLVYERRLMRLTPEEQRLYASTFAALDRVHVKKLLRAGRWRWLEEGEVLAKAGEKPDRLMLICEGRAEVSVDQRRIAELTPGRFVCEISFITQKPANATVRARGPLRCLIWEHPALERRLARDPELCAVMNAAIGSNLAAKISSHNAGATAAAAVKTELANGGGAPGPSAVPAAAEI
jgi:CRP-like cAMP-binding protein